MFASIGWPHAEKSSTWCVKGITVERDRNYGLKGGSAIRTAMLSGLVLLVLLGALLAPRER